MSEYRRGGPFPLHTARSPALTKDDEDERRESLAIEWLSVITGWEATIATFPQPSAAVISGSDGSGIVPSSACDAFAAAVRDVYGGDMR